MNDSTIVIKQIVKIGYNSNDRTIVLKLYDDSIIILHENNFVSSIPVVGDYYKDDNGVISFITKSKFKR
jgi:hypothetical protein